MLKKFASLGAGALLAFSASTQAAFLEGSISFNGFFDELGEVVSTLEYFEISDPGSAGSGTGSFTGVQGFATTYDIDLNNPAAMIYEIAGYTFAVDNIGLITQEDLACNGEECIDSKGFAMTGIVAGNGFDATAFTGNWTANGSCVGDTVGCTGDPSGSWSSSLTALGREEVPVPGTIALVALGLLGLRASLRRRAA